MSNNAIDAYDRGLRPRSKWTKADILDALPANARTYLQLDEYPLEFLREYFLEVEEWHHTTRGRVLAEGIYYYEVVRSAPKTVWLRQVTTVEAFVLRTFDFARIPVQGGFVNDTIIPCRLHKNGGLYIRGLQVHRYHGEVHDPRYDN